MIVDHADGLHHGVTDSRADEIETALAKVLAHGVGFGGTSRDLSEGFPAVPNGLAVDEAPEISVEAAELFLDGEEGFGVLDRGLDLQTVSNNAGVSEERFGLAGVVSGDLARIKSVECTAIVVPFVQNGGPTQAGLGALENEKLEQQPVVMNGHAPF